MVPRKRPVNSLGHDDILRFNIGDWVEITSDKREFEGRAGDMRKITGIDTDLTLASTGALDSDLNVADHLRAFRWDQSSSMLDGDGLIALPVDKPGIDLENGIQAELTVLPGGFANSGDYWCFAARTADADIERLDQAPPEGIHHHYCKLAIIESNGDVVDCRPVFPALTELTSLFYLSGDGQEAEAGHPLAKPIQVGVSRGTRPVAGARVRFSVTGGNGNLTADSQSGSTLILSADVQGIASCNWTLDMTNLSQQVEAQLSDGTHLPVRFNAALSQAGGIDSGIHVQRIVIGNAPLGNDSEVSVQQLANGIRFVCDRNLFPASVQDKPVCQVKVDIPFPITSDDKVLWGSDIIGFQPIVLAADVDSDKQTIFWRPKPETGAWLRTRLFKTLTQITRVLVHLTLKGNFVWDENNPGLFLDGDVFGTQAAGSTITDVKFPSGDGRSGGDLEMWFWLVQPEEVAVTITPTPPVLARRSSFRSSPSP